MIHGLDISSGLITWSQEGRNVFTGTWNDLQFSIVVHQYSASLIIPEELGGQEISCPDEAAAMVAAEGYCSEDRGLRLVKD